MMNSKNLLLLFVIILMVVWMLSMITVHMKIMLCLCLAAIN